MEELLLEINIRELQKKDYSKAIQFAIRGMHFNWYLDNKILLNLYGRYFWYMEMNRATQVIAAYIGDELAGVLLADMKGEEKKHYSFCKAYYVKIFDFLQNTFYKNGAGVYEETTKELLWKYLENNASDGEIIFLASNPEIKVKGIGSKLLSELEQRERGKKIYLHTDDACTYQFYENRGFERVCEKDVVLDMRHKKVPLKCLIYSKTT